MNQSAEVLAIAGPTASGKTALAVGIAHCLNGEVINGDAMQVYRGLDIGTAKITVDEMEGIPHHLFDIKSPTESFSAAEYQQLVREKISEIQSRGKLPILAGGTGLYMQSVLFDYRFTEAAANLEVRSRLESELSTLGAPVLYERLLQQDPVSAEKIHPNNHRRLVRALEILEVSGETKANHEADQGSTPMYHSYIIGLELPRELLYEKIDRRVDLMMDKGLHGEVKELWEQGIRNVQSVQAIGYKELYQAIDGTLPVEEAVELIKKNTRHYAKRQMTYFRNKLEVNWYDATTEKNQLVQKICDEVKGFQLHVANTKSRH
ncbi:tRNA (adenosine(37)-N6)-dimethylallyltransferase MiaA [Sporosarcina sp. BI001-red]|uniref:tRNA (adenosine(37)-N6)-dimethylallyltransferase MiaA n=1 Tax=Sporosarcina sp. BI001-red TaxID=2282866 RepID=UPI000E2472D6|nr:tRNA (adenosine(37)-N6)-dimethylallyltransferase MiaA [Sporosarcina sp. BI001-red]REB09831.1 tRNA (adenosine(37)-N6)-dimethylallyltransferase MiaA [Sporosarcina sp. BI001-red]